MDTTKHDIVMLLKYGLGLTTEVFPIKKNWDAILKDARMHAVSAIVFDGMSMFPKLFQPERNLLFQWYAELMCIEQKNMKLNCVLREIVSLYDVSKIPYVMMKGQGVAQRYPNPLHRSSGDIDLLILDGKFDVAVNLLVGNGAIISDVAPEKHTTLVWNGVVIELHHVIIDLCNPSLYRIMNGVDYAGMDKSVSISCEGNEKFEVPVLEESYELVYLLTHILHHLLTEGVGFRQVCDFALSMKCIPEEKIDAIRKLLKQTRLEIFFAAVAYICVDDVGVDSKKWEWSKVYLDKKKEKMLLEHIHNTGNFGRKSGEKVSSKTLWGNIQNAWAYSKHCMKFYSFAPDEVRWMMIVRTKRWLHKKMGK